MFLALCSCTWGDLYFRSFLRIFTEQKVYPTFYSRLANKCNMHWLRCFPLPSSYHSLPCCPVPFILRLHCYFVFRYSDMPFFRPFCRRVARQKIYILSFSLDTLTNTTCTGLALSPYHPSSLPLFFGLLIHEAFPSRVTEGTSRNRNATIQLPFFTRIFAHLK